MTRLARAHAITLSAVAITVLAACSSSGSKNPANQESQPSAKPVTHPISQFMQIINGGSSTANTSLHRTLCDDLLGTPDQISSTYFGGQSARMLSFTTGGGGVECAYSLDPATSTGDEDVQKDLVVSVDRSADQNNTPAAPSDTDATKSDHGVTIRVQRSDRAQLSAEAVAAQLLSRVTA